MMQKKKTFIPNKEIIEEFENALGAVSYTHLRAHETGT